MDKLFEPSIKAVLLAVAIVGLARIFTSGAPLAAPPNGPWLITPEEAALPPASAEERGLTGGMPFDIGREPPDIGPIIEVMKPREGVALTPPIEIAVRFIQRQQQIDLNPHYS